MDCAPLNLAHFHERRADKFIRHHRYDDAYKALETSLIYLQDAYKNVTIAKSIEVLNTQKWDFERKLRQIQMRKQQHERLKLKEIVPLPDMNTVVMLRPENSISAQSIAKSIDKTVEDFDAKFSSKLEQNMRRLQLGKENKEPKLIKMGPKTEIMIKSEQPITQQEINNKLKKEIPANIDIDENDDMPSLAPLELPSFDFDDFTSSSASFASIAGLIESFQK